MKTWSGVQQCLFVTLCMTLLPNVVLSQCGGHLTGESGEFTSPNFPERYPNDTECNWAITVPEGKNVNLTFLSFNVSGNGKFATSRVYIKKSHLTKNTYFNFSLNMNCIAPMISFTFMMVLM